LNFLYRPQLGDGHILLGAGPYIAYGITGSQTEKLDGEQSVKRTIRFKNSTDTDYTYYKPLDFGGNIFFGYEFYNGIFCQVNTQMGLYKINPDFEISDDKTSKKNIGFGLSAGYRFNWGVKQTINRRGWQRIFKFVKTELCVLALPLP
jgi:hypothetical protein